VPDDRRYAHRLSCLGRADPKLERSAELIGVHLRLDQDTETTDAHVDDLDP
jgi:hypothetical protein